MFTLFDSSVSVVASWILETTVEDLDVINFRSKASLRLLPPLLKPKLALAVLKKLHVFMSCQEHRESFRPLGKQRELLPLIVTCVTTSEILCCDGESGMRNYQNNKCDAAMSDVISKLDYSIRDELVNILHQNKNLKLKVLHYHSSYSHPTTLSDLIEKSADSIYSLKLQCKNFTMPRCRLPNLTELYLEGVRFNHSPELASLTSISSLYLFNVNGLPENLYQHLTCKVTLPNIENIL